MKAFYKKIEENNVFKQFFANLIKQKSHAFLFASESKSTLTLVIEYFLLKLNCLSKNNPCFECSNCLKILNKNCVDVNYFPTKNSLSVEDVAKIIAQVNVKPLDLKQQFFVINNIENSSFQAQNKLLKTLEEPPANVIFILTTSQEENVLSTIKSRCVKFTIPTLGKNDMKCFEDLFQNKNDFELASMFGGGNIGELLIDDNFFKLKEIYENAKQILLSLKKSCDVNALTLKIVKQKSDIVQYLKCFEIIYRNVMLSLNGLLPNDEFCENIDMLCCLNIIKKINKANEMLQSFAIETGVIDQLLFGILEEKYLCKQR